MWLLIGIIVAVSVVMFVISSRAYYPFRTAVGLPEEELGEVAPDDEIKALINAGRPRLITVFGLGGLFTILGLMMIKPF